MIYEDTVYDTAVALTLAVVKIDSKRSDSNNTHREIEHDLVSNFTGPHQLLSAS